MSTRLYIILAIFLASAVAPPANADRAVILLKNGARLEATVLRRPSEDEARSGSYVVRLDGGIRIKLDGRQIRKITDESPAEVKYQ